MTERVVVFVSEAEVEMYRNQLAQKCKRSVASKFVNLLSGLGCEEGCCVLLWNGIAAILYKQQAIVVLLLLFLVVAVWPLCLFCSCSHSFDVSGRRVQLVVQPILFDSLQLLCKSKR